MLGAESSNRSTRVIENRAKNLAKAKRNSKIAKAAKDTNDFDRLPRGFTVDITYIKSIDPNSWRNHDHYACLGLGEFRYNATQENIECAYRRLTTRHHPNVRKARGESINTDTDYFKSITKAYEILRNPKMRRAYDSVDPYFNDTYPTQKDIKRRFYEIFNKYFDLNSRWSEKRPVPVFGDKNSEREEVVEFYRFWYHFKSWRDFSYFDKEGPERYKENQADRKERKEKEMIRLQGLVDLAFSNDERIKKFQIEKKEVEMTAERAKMDAAFAAMKRIMTEAEQQTQNTGNLTDKSSLMLALKDRALTTRQKRLYELYSKDICSTYRIRDQLH